MNSFISSSKSSTAEVEAAALEVEAVREAATLVLRDLGWVGVFRTGLKYPERAGYLFSRWEYVNVKHYSQEV